MFWEEHERVACMTGILREGVPASSRGSTRRSNRASIFQGYPGEIPCD